MFPALTYLYKIGMMTETTRLNEIMTNTSIATAFEANVSTDEQQEPYSSVSDEESELTAEMPHPPAPANTPVAAFELMALDDSTHEQQQTYSNILEEESELDTEMMQLLPPAYTAIAGSSETMLCLGKSTDEQQAPSSFPGEESAPSAEMPQTLASIEENYTQTVVPDNENVPHDDDTHTQTPAVARDEESSASAEKEPSRSFFSNQQNEPYENEVSQTQTATGGIGLLFSANIEKAGIESSEYAEPIEPTTLTTQVAETAQIETAAIQEEGESELKLAKQGVETACSVIGKDESIPAGSEPKTPTSDEDPSKKVLLSTFSSIFNDTVEETYGIPETPSYSHYDADDSIVSPSLADSSFMTTDSMFGGSTLGEADTSFSDMEYEDDPSCDQEDILQGFDTATLLEPQELLSIAREFPSPYPADIIAIKAIEGKGHGIVAVRQIAAGTRILSEKVLVNTLPFSVIAQTLGLQENEDYVGQQLSHLDFHNLSAYSTLSPGRGFAPSFRNSDVVLSNGFEVMIAPDISVVKLFRNTSLYNHSCTPNTYWHFDYDKKEIVTQTIKDIREGEELTICYIEDGLRFSERSNRLRNYYGFTCVCPLCTGTSDELAEKDELMGKFKELQKYSGYLSPYSVPTYDDIVEERQKYYNILTWMTTLGIEGQLPMHQIFVGARRLFNTDNQRKAVLGFLAWEAVQRYMGDDSDEARFLIAQVPGLPVHYWASQGLQRYWSALSPLNKKAIYAWVFEDLPGDIPKLGPFAVLYRRNNYEW